MAEYFTEIIDPVDLTGYVREYTQGDLPFSDLLPPLLVDDIEYELMQLDHGGGPVARYRSWDTAPRLGRRPSVTTITGEIAPLGLSYRLNERDIKRMNNMRRDGGSRLDRRVIDQIYDDAGNAAKGVMNRVTWAHGELLTTGVVTLAELDPSVAAPNVLRAEFNVPAGHLGVSPAGADWDNVATSVPLADFKAWESTFRAANGGLNVEAWLISPEVESLLAQNAQVRAQLIGAPSGYVPTPQDMRSAARQFGVKGELITIDIERPLIDDDTQSGRVIPEQFVIGLRASALGNTLFTPSANAETLALAGGVRQMLTDELGVVAFQLAEINPPSYITTADGIILPVLQDPSALFAAEVYTP